MLKTLKLQLLICGMFFSSILFALENPEIIFPAVSNPLTPSKYWLENGKPYPTNAWFINFALIDHDISQPVNIMPYLATISVKGIGLSYPGFYNYIEPDYPGIVSAIYYQFDEQLTLGAMESMPDFGIFSWHGSRVNLLWRNDNQQQMELPIVQGAPYVTGVFSDIRPQLTSHYKWLSINKLPQSSSIAEGHRYEIVMAIDNHNTQTWIIYTENPITWSWTTSTEGEKLLSQKPYKGWLRLILQADTAQGIHNDAALLDTYSDAIPLDYQQNYSADDKNVSYSFIWHTQNDKPPLILSQPHQRGHFTKTLPVVYQGMKGQMQGEIEKIWNIQLPLLPITFLEPKILDAATITILTKSLEVEAKAFITNIFPMEGPYLTGKRIARVARLILIAHEIQAFDWRDKMLKRLKSILEERMVGKAGWFFQYDKTFGGIIPSVEDYGARHYNDHHYHYGYWVYTFAVLAKFELQWLTNPIKSKFITPKQWIANLILDYANKNRENPYFPMARHQDDYAGHSWASGLTADSAGQNEQSSSEAVNAYYALALYAMATDDLPSLNWARFLLARELLSAQTYWQIIPDNPIYNAQFTKNNRVIGNLWASKVDSNAYFIPCKDKYRCGLEYAFGMQMLPFTAISKHLFNPKWIDNSLPIIKNLLAGEWGALESSWKWILIKGIASRLNTKEKFLYFQEAAAAHLDDFDLGDSKTNTLYYLSNE